MATAVLTVKSSGNPRSIISLPRVLVRLSARPSHRRPRAPGGPECLWAGDFWCPGTRHASACTIDSARSAGVRSGCASGHGSASPGIRSARSPGVASDREPVRVRDPFLRRVFRRLAAHGQHRAARRFGGRRWRASRCRAAYQDASEHDGLAEGEQLRRRGGRVRRRSRRCGRRRRGLAGSPRRAAAPARARRVPCAAGPTAAAWRRAGRPGRRRPSTCRCPAAPPTRISRTCPSRRCRSATSAYSRARLGGRRRRPARARRQATLARTNAR